MIRRSSPAILAAVLCAWPAHAVAQAPPARAEMVSVTGCLAQGPNDTWLLTGATDPAVIKKGENPTTEAKSGKNRYKLIGVLELNVPAHKGHTVTVRGLLIAAQPERRINLTSIQMVSDSCAAGATTSSAKPKP